MNYIRVKDKNGLYRNENNNSIINMNQNEYDDYIKEYKKVYTDKQKINQLESDVNSIKSDLLEIKSLLKNLSNKF
jgi:hypothetical protein